MAHLNIFLTQKNSRWFENLEQQAQHNIGYVKESWTTRAMIALGPAEMEGKMFTVNEIERKLAPYIGFAENRHSLNNMVRRACRRGIITRTGQKRYAEGDKNPYPEYLIHGHLEIDNGGVFHSVVGGVCQPNERDDYRASRSVPRKSRVRARRPAY